MTRSSMARIGLGISAVALAAGATIVTAPTASAAQPDIACQKAGLDTLRADGLPAAVARDGLPISVAEGYGVTPRAGTDLGALPGVLPLSVVLADHRAGDDSLFLYPWCDEG